MDQHLRRGIGGSCTGDLIISASLVIPIDRESRQGITSRLLPRHFGRGSRRRWFDAWAHWAPFASTIASLDSVVGVSRGGTSQSR